VDFNPRWAREALPRRVATLEGLIEFLSKTTATLALAVKSVREMADSGVATRRGNLAAPSRGLKSTTKVSRRDATKKARLLRKTYAELETHRAPTTRRVALAAAA
jgi:hypothetical protein